MKREIGLCTYVCIFGLFLLHRFVYTVCNEASSVSASIPEEDFSTAEGIHTTESVTEITDNSILVSSATARHQHRNVTLGIDTRSLANNSVEVVENGTSETPVTSELSDQDVTVALGFNRIENQLDKDVPKQGTIQTSNSCSSYHPNGIIIDLSLGGAYRFATNQRQIQPNGSRKSRVNVGGWKSDNDTFVENGFLHPVYWLEGNYTISLLTDQHDFSAVLFTVDRINELQLIDDEGTLGLRVLLVQDVPNVQKMLEEETKFLMECLPESIGIFIAQSIWSDVQTAVDTIGYNIFPYPNPNDLLYAKAAHLLYELPWSNPNSSVVMRSESVERTDRFISICRHEHLCLESFPSNETIFVVLGYFKSESYIGNETMVVILSGRDELFISDLPEKSYFIAENSIQLSSLEGQVNISSDRYGSKLLASEIISSGSVFLEIVDLLNLLESQNCSGVYNGSCWSRNETLSNWKYYAKMSSRKIISQLELQNITHLMTFEMRQKFSLNGSEQLLNLKPIASSNMVTNITTVYHLNGYAKQDESRLKLGTIFFCAKEFESRHPDFGHRHRPVYYGNDYTEMYWQIKPEPWVAAGLTVSSLGILFCLAILIFLLVRVCMDDVLEGNPMSSILLLVSLIFQFGSFVPFGLEYTGYMPDLLHKPDTMLTWNTLCTIKIFLVSISYCTTFSLLLCRAIMLASIGSEGGFLSHVNGYLQSVICVFSTLVQLGLSVQLIIVLHAKAHSMSCNEIYFGNWFWAVISYDGLLLAALVLLSPFIFRSQRNYREGLLLVTGSMLCLVIWSIWIPLSMLGYEWREAAVSLGLTATALAVLVGIMVPRCFLMIRSIARSDLVQALPSLTSLAFSQANQYISEQSVYECVNPAMRQQRSMTTETFMDHGVDDPYMATSEIPTLPLRGNRRMQDVSEHGTANFYGISNPYNCSDSFNSEISPNKITRF
ncbi:protein bride of sevenless [Toxorhynchites rutilus septentrionalis]|uniref:protein bride of sevenless n=1 Tax=Toxorhynchites rutilus septentrionalis TaxID=329112 RepID=UPI0024791C55|nr:protein bride of sevenless [Toxorhynchites rutilus septentrionalis]XP_055638980.1 protein bride of sevenless [Toxorhynchites rutilus septentrionalis]XP_055638982.1 protein bride of sevenless [Toxorhynchites rutilus septentrionalis]XP_055638983.1 protein bride of sevenless [Toxorhynchites rutilus septentrionalis]XP_055638984.1 protein bride of sevenless [Toxorhynchites rutilus septentrionalis]XP_055638985.1 protein bride of sevenless [Toxorhynchites rutilus septentrionalis]XP_055638986.1 pr